MNGVQEDREALCKLVIREAEKGKIEIVTSYLCFAEVCKPPKAKSSQEDRIAAYFEHEYILGVPVDRVIGENARKLMMSGFSGLKPPDAIHVASAALANVREMHTFDERLLDMSEKVICQDGRILKIVKPNLTLPPAPLLDEANK